MRIGISVASALSLSLGLLGWTSPARADDPASTAPASTQDDAAKLKAIREKIRDKMVADKAAAEAAKKNETPKPEEAAKSDKLKQDDEAPDKNKGLEKKQEKLEEKSEKLDDRMKALAERIAERDKDREDRRRAHRTALFAKYGKGLESPPVREELRLHGRRMARLNRIKELAEAKGNEKLSARVEKLITLEMGRHERHLSALANAGAAPASATKEAK